MSSVLNFDFAYLISHQSIFHYWMKWLGLWWTTDVPHLVSYFLVP